MAKTSSIERNKKRIRLAKLYEARRKNLKNIVMNKKITLDTGINLPDEIILTDEFENFWTTTSTGCHGALIEGTTCENQI